jgi:hypothetical protein
LFYSDKLGFSEHYVRTDQTIKKVFWLLFLKKVTARRAGEKTPFLFCQAFFFVAILPKKKALQKANYL